jgi:hypothetical protein
VPATDVAAGDRHETLLERLAARERALWALLAVALLADAVLTWYGLQRGLTEANPVMAAAMAWLGVAGGIVAVKGAAVGVAGVAHASVSPPNRPVVPLAMAVPWTLAAVINVAGLLLG